MQNFRIANALKDECTHHISNGLYHYIQVKLAYNSNRIEGSRLTEEQTRYIYETHSIITGENTSANIDDIIETINHFRAFDYILKNCDEPLSEDMIKKIHHILKSNTSAENLEWFNIGDYKACPNTIGDFTLTTSPENVHTEIEKLIYDYNSDDNIDLNRIIDFHHAFESIHPFQDGNGRVGRLIMFKECLKNNVMPFIIDDERKLFYYRGLKEYKQEKGFLKDTCLLCQDNFEAVLNYFYPNRNSPLTIKKNDGKHR